MSLPPGYSYPLPPAAPERPKRRWWLIAIVVVWALILAGFAAWSVRHDPPTVPEQRDIAEALPVVQRATGQLVAAADAPDRVLTLGPLEFDRDCALTPLRDGVQAVWDVTVRVRANEAPAVLEAVAKALPKEFDAAVRRNKAGTRYAMRADAGAFVGVDAAADSDAELVTFRVSTGCRPLAAGVDLDAAPPAATETPDAFVAAVRALGTAEVKATASEVGCPAGGTARTVTADGLAAPKDLGQALRPAVAGAVVVQSDPHAWAYRSGDVSMVVTDADGTARITATTGCR